MYCAASVSDLREPMEYIYQKYCLKFEENRGHNRSFFLIGNSMGANIVANYLGEEGPKSIFKAACCI